MRGMIFDINRFGENIGIWQDMIWYSQQYSMGLSNAGVRPTTWPFRWGRSWHSIGIAGTMCPIFRQPPRLWITGFDIAIEQLKVMDVHIPIGFWPIPNIIQARMHTWKILEGPTAIPRFCLILSDHPRMNREKKDVVWDSTGKHLAAAKRSLWDAVAANEAAWRIGGFHEQILEIKVLPCMKNCMMMVCILGWKFQWKIESHKKKQTRLIERWRVAKLAACLSDTDTPTLTFNSKPAWEH